jgi:chemotaxis protein MotA
MSVFNIFSMIFAFVVVIISILISGDITGFLDAPSAFCVLGGVLFVSLASYSPERIKGLLGALKIAFRKQEVDLSQDIETIVNIANDARRNGLLALEEMTEKMDEPFLKKGILLVVDGCDQELIRSIMETELAITKQRHADNRAILESAGAYSPAFGMLGTLIGLVNMLANLDDLSSLGPNMSVALVTTVYGTVLANMVFNPLSKRLRTIGGNEYLRKELILEGIMAIQNGENPRVIREKLNAFLSNATLKTSDSKKKVAVEE